MEFTNTQSENGIIGIEVKYTEGLGANKASQGDDQKQDIARRSGIFNDAGIDMVTMNPTQGIRNILLTEAVRLIDGYKNSTSVVLAPEGNRAASNEVDSLKNLLNSESVTKLQWISLEEMARQVQHSCSKEFQGWINSFIDRYIF